MPDYYYGPALVLTALLLPAFGFLYLRSRSTRTLLWFLAFLFALFSMVLSFPVDAQGQSPLRNPWMAAAAQTALQLSCALFLGSLSQLRFRCGARCEILYVIPYIIPLVAASILFYGVFHGVAPGDPLSLIFPLLFGMSFAVGMIWGNAKGSVPSWIGVSFSGVLGCAAIWLCESHGPLQALNFAGCVNILMAVILLIFCYRRLSPGIVLSVMGFVAWSLSFLRMVPWVGYHAALDLNLARVIAMSKVLAALGMIVLSLEDELNANKAARERERRARQQLEAYTNLMLTRRRVEDFDHQASDICEIIVKHSRFTQAALILQHEGRYRLAGSAGIGAAITKPLAALAKRIHVDGFVALDKMPPVVERCMTRQLSLKPWFLPGDDLERLRFTSMLAVPLWNHSSADGALLLSGLRTENSNGLDSDFNSPNSDDLLPIELLVTRLQATRSQTMLFEKLIDAEKYAGLGQLASNVTQQLNNPLTVVLGYATLLEESPTLDPRDRKAVNSIVGESRRIRATLESLSRISRAHADMPAAISVTELINDMERLYRTEFLLRSIDFQVHVTPGLPRVLCGAQQLRQAVLHCLQYAMGAVQREVPEEVHAPKTIRLEAASEGNLVQISVMHSGPGFAQQERAFDPFTLAAAGAEMDGLGLSLCATILRDQNGRASAVNLEPRGAAIILEVQAA
jgi:signal transduction histidine kinase/ABC-type sugar transport system permease subunit